MNKLTPQQMRENLERNRQEAKTQLEQKMNKQAESGSNMGTFRQLDEESRKQPVPDMPLTFNEWASRGNPNNPTLSKIAAGATYPIAKAVDMLVPDPVKNWAERGSQSGGEVMTMVDNPNKVSTGSTAGDITADLLGGLAGFMTSGNGAGIKSLGSELWQGSEKALADILPRIPGINRVPGLAGKGVERIAPRVPVVRNTPNLAEAVKNLTEYTGKIGGATAAFEGTRAIANDREISPGEMGLAAGANVALDLATRGLLKGIAGRRGIKTGADEIPEIDSLFDEITPDTGEYSIKYPPKQPLALPEGKTEVPQSNIPNFETVGQPYDSRFPQPKAFSQLQEELIPKVNESTTPSLETRKAMVDYIYDGLGGDISKNEIRKMSNTDLEGMAQDIANQRKSDLWGTMKTEAEKQGYDLDNLYRMETDPAYSAERERLAEAAGLPKEAAKFKLKRSEAETGNVKEKAPAFYSQLQRVIEQKMPNRATPEQIKGIVSKGTVKEEELKWSGLDDFLAERQGQKVTKQEVMDYLRENDVQIQEVTPDKTKYDQYQLPGGENYRELLFTMPINYKEGQYKADWEFGGHRGNYAVVGPDGKAVFLSGDPASIRNKLIELNTGKSVYQSGHWVEPNVLAHVRFNSRTGANGEKILHVEEVQSDWHQEGRKKGYKGKAPAELQKRFDEAKEEMNRERAKYYSLREELGPNGPINEQKQAMLEAERAFEKIRDQEMSTYIFGVPDAPFKTTWTEFVMKRMIRYAAENGYDRISWTTGAQQAERYDLSKQVKFIGWQKQSNGKYHVTVKDPELNLIYNEREKTIDDIEALAGKEIAKKIQSSAENNGVIEGDGLKIGGSGMSGFYDRMIPAWLNKYAKKWGSNVENVDLDISNGRPTQYADFYDYKDAKENGRTATVHSIPITDSMRQSVLYEGQPKFKLAASTSKKIINDANRSLEIYAKDPDRLALDESAFENPAIQLADKVANALSGTSVIPVKMPTFMDRVQGFLLQDGKKIILNSNMEDPATYVTMHEATHRMQLNFPEQYDKMLNVAVNNLKDDHKALIERYQQRGYEMDEMPDEFFADLMAEMLHDQSFIGKLRDSAPEVIQPLLKVIDEVIQKVKLALSKDDSVLPFIENLERLRSELAPEYKSYMDTFANRQNAGIRRRWQAPEGVAAKQGLGKGATKLEPTDTPEFRRWFGDSKVVDKNGEPLAPQRLHQAISSADTSLNQVASTFKSRYFTPGKLNIDIGGGKYGKATDYLRENYGTENLVFDPFNRNSTENQAVTDRLLGGERGETATANNVLNVIAEPNVRANVIKQVAKAIRPDGKAYFLIYEGNASGLGQATTKGWQNNLKAESYIKEVSQHFESVARKGNLIIASTPKNIKDPAMWELGNNQTIRFKLGQGNSRTEDLRNMVLAAARQLPESAGFNGNFKAQILKQFPQVADEPQVDAILKFVYDRASELRKGQTAFKDQGQVVSLTKKDLMQGGEPGKAAEGNPQDWNHIASKTQRIWPGIKQAAKNAANATYRGTTDDLYRLNQLDNYQKKQTGRGLSADEKAYILALNSRESGGTSKAILTDALYDSQGNKIGDSLSSITKQIPKGTENDFSNYLVYRHAPSWLEQGRQVFPEGEFSEPVKKIAANLEKIKSIENNPTYNDKQKAAVINALTKENQEFTTGMNKIVSQRTAAYEQAHSEFKQAADELVSWQRDFGKAWLVDTGIIKPETWDLFQQMYPDYIPLQRKMEDIEVGGPGVRRGYANQPNPVKKAEGSERQIIDPIESIIEQVDKYVKVARRNEVMQAVIKNIQKDQEAYGDWIEVIPEDKNAGQSLGDALLQDGIDGVIDNLDQPFQAAHEGRKVRLDRPNVVTGIVDGEKVHVKVNDPALLDALAKLTPQAANKIVESVRQVTRTMKVLTTGANVFFASRNIVRDLPMSYINSHTTNNPVRWAWDILDSAARVATNGKYDPGKYYQTYKALGGGSHSSSIAADRNLLAESKAAVMPGYYDSGNMLKTAIRGLKTGSRGIESFTNAVETIPRLPEYIRTAKTGGDSYAARQQGLYAAQDVTVNFSRHGSLAKDADAFIPYLNASLQGLDKMARSYKDNPVATVAKSIIAVTVPTIGLYTMFNHDNPDYKKLSSYVKDNNFCIPIDGGKKFIKIAKPREAGVVFSSLVERCLRKWANDDPEGFKGFREAWVNNFVPPVRSIAAPLNDIRSNKNFADIPIVPGYMERLSPELQYDENTSAPAKTVGKALKVSPKKLDYLTRSYTGFIGELGIPAASSGKGESASQRVGDVLKKTYVADPLYSNDILTQFYDEKERLDRGTADANYQGTKKPNREKATRYNRAAGQIGDLSKRIRNINKQDALSFKEKQSRTRDLRRKMVEIAERAMK